MPRRLPSAALLALLALPAFAQEEKKAEAPQPPDPLTQEAYILPPPVIDRAVRTDWAEQATVSNMSPDRTLWFDVVGEGLARLADVRRPFLNLAGLQVDPSSDQPRGWTLRRNRALRIHRMSDLGVVEVKLPAGVSPQSVTWSPDSKRLAFIGASDSGSHLYVADAVGGQVRRVGDRRLMGTLSDSLSWSSDSRRIAAVFMPEDRPKSPEGAGLAPSPWVRVADPAQKAIRSFPDRLEDPSDA
ncbi:MAG: hypothetical protein MH204_07920 [Fimbriimonadaceae bacterium]|nr:hypothetical protein [Fimbriimonadaceae bacterium]